MYVHPAFKTELPAIEAFVQARGFGTLVAFDGSKPVAVHVPFLYAPAERRLELHVARANPIHEVVAANPSVLLTCTGPDAYIAPTWYASPNQVPTWNYIAAHLTGQARIMASEDLRSHVERLSERFESDLPGERWSVAKVEPQRVAAMLTAIVGIVVAVESVEGNWKLGQHKGSPDHEGAVSGLRAQGGPDALAVADLMDAAREIRR
jgi:transcriptional regulator